MPPLPSATVTQLVPGLTVVGDEDRVLLAVCVLHISFIEPSLRLGAEVELDPTSRPRALSQRLVALPSKALAPCCRPERWRPSRPSV